MYNFPNKSTCIWNSQSLTGIKNGYYRKKKRRWEHYVWCLREKLLSIFLMKLQKCSLMSRTAGASLSVSFSRYRRAPSMYSTNVGCSDCVSRSNTAGLKLNVNFLNDIYSYFMWMLAWFMLRLLSFWLVMNMRYWYMILYYDGIYLKANY